MGSAHGGQRSTHTHAHQQGAGTHMLRTYRRGHCVLEVREGTRGHTHVHTCTCPSTCRVPGATGWPWAATQPRHSRTLATRTHTQAHACLHLLGPGGQRYPWAATQLRHSRTQAPTHAHLPAGCLGPLAGLGPRQSPPAWSPATGDGGRCQASAGIQRPRHPAGKGQFDGWCACEHVARMVCQMFGGWRA